MCGVLLCCCCMFVGVCSWPGGMRHPASTLGPTVLCLYRCVCCPLRFYVINGPSYPPMFVFSCVMISSYIKLSISFQNSNIPL